MILFEGIPELSVEQLVKVTNIKILYINKLNAFFIANSFKQNFPSNSFQIYTCLGFQNEFDQYISNFAHKQFKHMFTKAFVRRPCKGLEAGITTANLGLPDFTKALEQHQHYVNALKKCGLDVIILEADENFPDSTFIEDTALLTPHCAVIMRPGAQSRRGEITAVAELLKDHFENIEAISSPGTVEAGDIMMVGKHFYIGLSERTNEAGADQLIEILLRYGMTGSKVNLNKILHLKTGLSYLENNTLVISHEFLNHDEFKKFTQIEIKQKEAYAANCIWVNDTVIIPEGFPKSKSAIEAYGFKTIEVDVSEFQKLDGGLSCLSLRF